MIKQLSSTKPLNKNLVAFFNSQPQCILQRNYATRIANMGPTVTAPRELVQDVAPPGGFAPVRIRRNMPRKFWGNRSLMLAIVLVMSYGWYKYYKGYAKKNQTEYERYIFAEVSLTPFLQAEKDLMLAIERRAFRKKVAELKEVDEELKNDESFNPEWDQFYKVSSRLTYPFNSSHRYVNTHNFSVSFKGTGLPEREKQYLDELKKMK